MGWGSSSVQTKAPQTGTLTGNALIAAGNFSNDHSKTTKVVEGTTAVFLATWGANALFKAVAPEKHNKWIAQPIQNNIVAPLQKKGWINSNDKQLEARGWDSFDVLTLGAARLFRTNVVAKN